MLRALSVAIVVWIGFAAAPAVADPTLSDDLTSCRQPQHDPKTRQEACERVIADGQTTGKDLAIAFAVRGNGFFQRRNLDKAIEAYSTAITTDPDNARDSQLAGQGL